MLCVGVGLTLGTRNHSNGAGRSVLEAEFVQWRACVQEECASRGWWRRVCAWRAISRIGWSEKDVWEAGVAAQCHLWRDPQLCK